METVFFFLDRMCLNQTEIFKGKWIAQKQSLQVLTKSKRLKLVLVK